MRFKFYLESKQIKKSIMMVVNTELSVTKEEIRSLLRGRTPYCVHEQSSFPIQGMKVFNSLAETVDFLSTVKFVGTIKDCEFIIKRKKLMSFCGRVPFKVSHSRYLDRDYTFFSNVNSANTNYPKSLELTIRTLFCDYTVRISKLGDPYVPTKIVLERAGGCTHAYEERKHYYWVEKRIIAKY